MITPPFWPRSINWRASASILLAGPWIRVFVLSIPPVKIIHNGIGVGQTFKLKASTGKIQFGTGKDPATDPFTIKVRYKVEGDSITYTIDAAPWAIVRGTGGIGLGRTPLSPQTVNGTSTFEFVNPKEKLQLRVTVRFSR